MVSTLNKNYFLTATGFLGVIIEKAFGGWSDAMTTLVVFMAIDYISGVLLGVTNKSLKTESGGLNSNVSFKGLCRKGMILLIVLIGHRLDLVLKVNFLKDVVIIAFIANETVSIIENAGLMGVTIPSALRKAIDVLNKKSEEVTNNEYNKDVSEQ